jgi:hypothetical protein
VTFAQLVEQLEKAPALLAALVAAITAGSVTMGAIGTWIEHIGFRMGWRRVERFGQFLEAVFSDLPKALRGSRKTAELNARVDAAVKSIGAE